MEVSESSVAAPDVQTSPSEGSTGAESSPAAAENSESLKGAAVSVIQSPKKSNGVAQSERVPNGHSTEDQLTNGSEPQSDAAEKQPDSIEQLEKPGEQLPAELLQSDSSLTTVASLIEKSAEESENGAPPAPAAAAVPTVTPRKTTAAELADDWETDEPVSDAEMTAPAAASDNKDQSSADADKDQPAASDNKDQPAADKDQPAADASVVAATDEKSAEAPLTPATAETDESSPPRKSGRKVKPTEKVLEAAASAAGDVEESVEAIAKELATSNTPKSGKAAAAAKKTPAAKESEEEAGGEEKKSSAKKAGRPKKKDLDEKVDNVTKLGNNMYFYTGPGGQDSPPPLNSDEEDLDFEMSPHALKGEKDSSARKSARAGKGRNPRLEREDEEVAIPTKVPPKANHNLNPNWLKTAAKNAEKDKKATTPVKKKSAAPQPDAAAAAVVAEAAAEVAEAMDTSENTASPAQPPASPPKDDELPEFDPEKFTPGYTPKTVKKGNDEYMIVVEGVKDTGLCGKYWGDLSNLPSRRRSKQPEQLNVGTPDSSRQRRGSMSSTGSADSPAASKKAVKKADTPTAPKSAKKQVTKPETPKAANGEAAETTAGDETKPQVKAEDEKKETEKAKTPAGGRGGGRKRKVDSPAAAESGAKKQKSQSDESEQDGDSKEQVKKGKGKTAEPKVSSKNAAAVSAALAAGVPAGQQRSVSCVSDTSTQKEVVVECFAPYDDHRWVNIGKERDGMTPDAVQYARALRPPYHLLSFLRIKGHSTKGMSCTDKNTMVFVVLEGEITVILHTTQFNAKKGDSFYIPPKNYYNLINQKAREAELSLIQFQYDGPLPTVNPSTQ